MISRQIWNWLRLYTRLLCMARLLCVNVCSQVCLFARCSQVDQNETLYNSFLKWKTEPFQPGFEEQVATGMERMFCRVCEAVVS